MSCGHAMPKALCTGCGNAAIWNEDDGVCRQCWRERRLEEILAHRPYRVDAWKGDDPKNLGKLWHRVEEDKNAKAIEVLKDLRRAADVEQIGEELREHLDRSASIYLCHGSGQPVMRHWSEPGTGIHVGMCDLCLQTVVCYLDLQRMLACEHVGQGKGNTCSECDRAIYDEDYLCVWCRMDITVDDV